jgi:hypothetical protein
MIIIEKRIGKDVDRKGLVGRCYYTGIFLEELGKTMNILAWLVPPPLYLESSLYLC